MRGELQSMQTSELYIKTQMTLYSGPLPQKVSTLQLLWAKTRPTLTKIASFTCTLMEQSTQATGFSELDHALIGWMKSMVALTAPEMRIC